MELLPDRGGRGRGPFIVCSMVLRVEDLLEYVLWLARRPEDLVGGFQTVAADLVTRARFYRFCVRYEVFSRVWRAHITEDLQVMTFVVSLPLLWVAGDQVGA